MTAIATNVITTNNSISPHRQPRLIPTNATWAIPMIETKYNSFGQVIRAAPKDDWISLESLADSGPNCSFSATPFRPAMVVRFAGRWHDAGMDAKQVTRLQARTIKKRLEPTRDYLIKLHQRMKKRGFDPDDELMALVIAADHALQHLCNDLFIRTLDGPTAPPPEPKSLGISKRALEARDRQQRNR